MTKNVSFKVVDPNEKDSTYQPVFLSFQFFNGFSLEFSLTTKDSLNNVTIELLNDDKDIICKESFKYKIEEFKWYSLIITKQNEHKYVRFLLDYYYYYYENLKTSFFLLDHHTKIKLRFFINF